MYRARGEALIRSACLEPNCNNLQRFKGLSNTGKRKYGRLCDKHHRLKFNMPPHDKIFFQKRGVENKVCEECGWDKAYCDRHRIVPSKGYIEGNVKILCPNCHRLATVKNYVY